MFPELYSITPRVVVADTVTEIAVKGNFPHSDLRTFQGEFTVDSVGPGGLFQNGDLPGYTCGNGFSLGRPPFEPVPAALDENGILRFKYDFKGEGQTTFRITIGERVITTFFIYAVRREWLDLRPYRGDLHLHSGYSGCCGEKNLLCPEYYAALNRSMGLDFIAISDHKQHYPSLKAADFVDQCGAEFQVYPSEEVHLPDLHTIHNLSFGSSKPISDQLHRGNPVFDQLLAKYMNVVPDFSDDFVRYLAAAFHVVHDLVHEAGGVNVFCHPFWRPFDRLFLPRCIRDYVFEHNLFDCIELFGAGSQNCDETSAVYHEECQKLGRRIPAVGNTDAHKHTELGLNSTVVFAKANDFVSLREAILSNNNVVVRQIPGQFPRVSGSSELVSFYHFLRNNYYPRHDELCVKEADLMFKAFATGSPDVEYDRVVNTPYAQRIGIINDFTRNTFTPDRAAFAAVQAEFAALEQEFWG